MIRLEKETYIEMKFIEATDSSYNKYRHEKTVHLCLDCKDRFKKGIQKKDLFTMTKVICDEDL